MEQMEDVAAACKVVAVIMKPIIHETSYAFYYKSKAAKLKEKVQELQYARERVQSSVTVATRNGEEILQQIKNWQDSAIRIAPDPEKGLEEGEKPEKEKQKEKEKAKCFFGLCPNLKYRYELGKKADQEAGTIAKLLEEERSFNGKVSLPLDPQDIWASSSKSYMAFDSRKSILDEILGALKDATLERIGVHGIAGVGKTTMIKQVAKEAKQDKLFDVVALAVVTGTPDVRSIQGEIADFLGLKFDEETVAGRANRLSIRLKKEKKVLVILDDIWTSLKLDEVGIAFGDHEHRGCKVLLSSRDRSVLPEMDAERLFPVDPLEEKEAWNLFKKMAGDIVEDPNVRSTAIDACRRCEGLPISIAAAAKALKNKPFSEWETASKQLTGSPTMAADPRSAIELSFNHLANEELKSAFLLCGLMPYNATIFDLLKYGMTFGLLGGITTMEEAHQRLHRLVQNLKSSCLLFDGRMDEDFTMHEVIRDVAASIAFRDRKMFVMRNGIGKRELQDTYMLRNCTSISLFYNDSISLPAQLECPQLKVFQLYNKNPSLRFSNQFFSTMKELKVLDLKGMQHFSLPSSSHGLLGDLQTLSLESCFLQDIAMVNKMKKLEILSFNSSIIEELPEEIGQLTQLRLLNLDNCSKLRVIPPNVISNLSQLEELYIGNSFAEWEDEQRAGRHASLGELNHLPQLTCLNLHIPDYRTMPKKLLSEKLQRFKILIGNTWDWSDKHEASRMLKLKLNESIHLNYGVQMLLKKTEDLYLDELKDVRDFLHDLDVSKTGFPQLKHLHIQNALEMKHIIETHKLDAFPVLESLYLQNLINLEKICNDQLGKQPFTKLRVVKAGSCHRLKNLFSFSIARGLLQLEEIEVVDCMNMVEVIAEGRGSDVGENEATIAAEFGQLKLLTLQKLPKLISINASSTTVALFNQRVTFPNLQNLKLSSINRSEIWQQQLLSVQNLTSITVEGCGSLKFLLSSSMANSLAQLIHLEISECKLLEEIIEEMTGEEGMEKILFPKLSSLKMKGLQKLTRFFSGKVVQFPSLKQLHIEHCPKLGTFISKFVKKEMGAMKERKEMVSGIQPLFNEMVAFPSLEKMTISYLQSMIMLWNNQLPEGSFCRLKTMEVEYCQQLKTIFPFIMVGKFQSLETLILNDSASLEQVFEVQGLNTAEENEAEAAVPLKKLHLYNLPKLKHVWSQDPQGLVKFKNLTFVYVFGCESLKNLFPASVARGLLQLERVEIDTCGVQEIVAKDETPQPDTRFVFPELSFLRLWKLKNLKSFYPGVHSTEWSKLKKFVSYHLGDMQIFTSELLSSKISWKVSQPLFVVEKVVRNLEELTVESSDISILCLEVFPASLFSNVKMLKVHCYHQESDIFPFGFIQKFSNLEKLDVGCCKFKELFPSEGLVGDQKKPLGTLSRVRSLELVLLANLRHIWKPNSRADLIPPGLEALVVWRCSKLVNLAPSSSSFSNLTTLDVWRCHGAEHIFASSTAKSLVQLTKMSVRECNKVTEIVANDGETLTEIIFSKLVCLELNWLPSLLYFSSGSYALKFPSLEDVTVVQCRSLTNFYSGGELSTPKLQKVWVTEEMDRSCWEGNLNATAAGKMV